MVIAGIHTKPEGKGSEEVPNMLSLVVQQGTIINCWHVENPATLLEHGLLVTTLKLKRATGIIHSQRMASIAPIVIGYIDYLAYGTIFTRAMFRPKIKLDVFFDERWWEVMITPWTFCYHRSGFSVGWNY
jgi:hypothetical protein